MSHAYPEHMLGRLLILDGDDTLWLVEPLYDEARIQAGKAVTAAGLDAQRWERIQRKLDVENVRHLGLSPERFPTSCLQAYRALIEETGRPPNPHAEAAIRSAAMTVFDRTAPVIDGAAEVLQTLVAASHRLVLLTKGSPEVQWKRIRESELASFFESVHVVPEKSDAAFAAICRSARVSPVDAWSIGNSLPSDINPALRIGMGAVWIDAEVWGHERRETEPGGGRLIRIKSLRDLPAVLPHLANEQFG
jgi:putative hydrolase of the HAD superfamily